MDVPSLKKALLDPAIFPDPSEEIELIETHISILFLTNRYVYKVKKPVDFGFLDFTSLEKRRYFCEREVFLNRRLAPSVYLGVVKIAESEGKLSLEAEGEVIDYAVKMKRIPGDRFLDKLLVKNQVTREMIRAVSKRLARFYAKAHTSEFIRSFARPERIKQDTDENFEQTEKYVGASLPDETYASTRERTNEFLRTREKVFHERMSSGHIRDCHGDLRLEHIVWGEEIFIIDCIEFNERFRYTDVAADLAFLAMDLDYHGREDLSEALIRIYRQESGDGAVWSVLNFYKCYRAYVRGKVESFKSEDTSTTEADRRKALERARKYFTLAHRYALML